MNRRRWSLNASVTAVLHSSVTVSPKRLSRRVLAALPSDDILHAILPPREWIEDQKHYIQYVSNQSATRLDVIQLQEALDQRLMERQARETGICPVREELYSQCFDELIRQVTINCAER